MDNQQYKLLFLAVLVCNVTTAAVQPADISAGPISITPFIQIEQGYDDNIYSASIKKDIKDSIYTILSPTIEAVAEDGLNAYRASFLLQKGIYYASTEDNFLDYDAALDVHIETDARNSFDISARISDRHEAQGTGIAEFNNTAYDVDKPLRYDEFALSGSYTHGAETAQGQLIIDVGYEDKQYTNFRDITTFRDTDIFYAGAALQYQAKPKTSLLLEARYKDIDYITDYESSLDSTTLRLLAGLSWESSARTTGTIKLGRVERHLPSPDRDDFSGNSWQAVLLWSPRTYSTFRVSTSQTEKESNNRADFINSQAIRLSWNHRWNDQFLSVIRLGKTHDDFIGSEDNRVDDSDHASIELNYDLRRWLSIGGSWTMQDTESNVEGIPFKRNVFAISVDASL